MIVFEQVYARSLTFKVLQNEKVRYGKKATLTVT